MDKKSKKEAPLTLQQDSFDRWFVLYESEASFEPFRSKLRESRFRTANTETSSRIITHWDNFGLLPEGSATGGWRSFSLTELVWLEAIKAMRSLGLDLQKIKQVKDKVLDWNKKVKRYPIFEYYIFRAWATDADPQIVISEDNADIGTRPEIEVARMAYGSKSVFLISLKELLRNLGFKTEELSILYQISDSEKKILTAIRFYGADKLEIKLKNGKAVSLDSTKIFNNVDLPKNFEIESDFKDKEEYGDVATRFEKGKRRSMKITKKEKL